jgi:TPR repeat protein
MKTVTCSYHGVSAAALFLFAALATAGCASYSRVTDNMYQAEEIFKAGVDFSKDGRYHESVEQMTKAIDRYRHAKEECRSASDCTWTDDLEIIYAKALSRLYSNRARAYMGDSRIDQAVRDARTAVEYDEESPSAYGALVLALFLAGDEAEARDELRVLKSIDGKSAKAAEDLMEMGAEQIEAGFFTATPFGKGKAAYDAGDYMKAHLIWRPLAEQGDARAQYYLGVMYANGYGVGGNAAEALKWFEAAGERGYVDAQNQLGYLYEEGKAVKKDEVRAFKWYRRAAEGGNAAAQFNLARMYGGGLGTTKDIGEAFRWYLKSAEGGNAEAQIYVGHLYETGTGVDADVSKAVTWYKKAADQGHVLAYYNLGDMCLNGRGVRRNAQDAFAWYLKAAKIGFAEAQSMVGYLYARGEGVRRDDKSAVEWYKKAADQGYAVAQCNLANRYRSGLGVKKDAAKSVLLYRMAADQQNEAAITALWEMANEGVPEAQFHLGKLYEEGKRVQQNYSAAFQCYSIAASKGYAPAQNALAAMYVDGKAVPKNYGEAEKWWLKAANQGHQRARYNLASFYSSEEAPDGKDLIKAYMWYKLGLEAKPEEEVDKPLLNINALMDSILNDDSYSAGDRVQMVMKLFSVEKSLTEQQLIEAKRRVSEWKNKHKRNENKQLYSRRRTASLAD